MLAFAERRVPEKSRREADDDLDSAAWCGLEKYTALGRRRRCSPRGQGALPEEGKLGLGVTE